MKAQSDNASPPEDPVWDEYDAMAVVAEKLHRDIVEVLADVADAAQTLAWLAERVDLDGEHATLLLIAFLVTYLAALSAAERADGRTH